MTILTILYVALVIALCATFWAFKAADHERRMYLLARARAEELMAQAEFLCGCLESAKRVEALESERFLQQQAYAVQPSDWSMN
jgi:hypothetical protein